LRFVEEASVIGRMKLLYGLMETLVLKVVMRDRSVWVLITLYMHSKSSVKWIRDAVAKLGNVFVKESGSLGIFIGRYNMRDMRLAVLGAEES
jgi:hypothetical protein